MKMGAEDKKKLGILAVVGVLALGALFYMYSELSTPDVAAARDGDRDGSDAGAELRRRAERRRMWERRRRISIRRCA